MKGNHRFLKKIIVGRETTQAVRGLVKLLQSTLIHREMCLYSIVPQEYGKQSKDNFSRLLPQNRSKIHHFVWQKNIYYRPKVN